MSRIEIRIVTDNDAFRDEEGELVVAEVNRLLDHTARLLADGFRDGFLRDVNGARCGEFTVVEDAP